MFSRSASSVPGQYRCVWSSDSSRSVRELVLATRDSLWCYYVSYSGQELAAITPESPARPVRHPGRRLAQWDGRRAFAATFDCECPAFVRGDQQRLHDLQDMKRQLAAGSRLLVPG